MINFSHVHVGFFFVRFWILASGRERGQDDMPPTYLLVISTTIS